MRLPSGSVRDVLAGHWPHRLAILMLPDYDEPLQALMERHAMSDVPATTLLATDRYDTNDGGT